MEEGTLFPTSNLDDYNTGIDLLNELIKETSSCNNTPFVDELIGNGDHDQIGLHNTTYGYSSSCPYTLPELDTTKMCVFNDQDSMLLLHETCNSEDCTRKPGYDSIYREDCTTEDQEKEHAFQYCYIDIKDHGKNICHTNGEDSIINTPTIYNQNYITTCIDHIGEQGLRENLGGKCNSAHYKKQSDYYHNVCAQECSPSNSCSWENSSCNSTTTSSLEPNAISIKPSTSKKRTRRKAKMCTICSTLDECVCDDQYRSLAINRELKGVDTTTTMDKSNDRSWREVIYTQAALQGAPDWHDIVMSAAASRPKRRHVRISSHPQTAAARHRRERISLRLRVLQRLVPGCTHMDTVSMLDETIHYLKFLKKQLQALECLQKSLLIPSSISSPLPNSYAIPNDQLNSIALCSY